MRRARQRVAAALAGSGLHVVDVPRVTDAAVPTAVIVPRVLAGRPTTAPPAPRPRPLTSTCSGGADEDEAALEDALDAALAALAAPGSGVLVSAPSATPPATPART